MKKLLLASALFSFFALTMSCQKDADAPAPAPSYDSLVIVSVTPTTGITQTSTAFTVEVKYRLQSAANGQLVIAFNNGNNVASYDKVESASVAVAKGSGTHTFNVTIIPKKWTSPNKFACNVSLYSNSTSTAQPPLAGDYQEIKVN